MANYLIHYASPYYDPVKAHEYYEQHKKLKGRRSTAGLNDTGKEAAKYVKSQIDAEKKMLIDKAKHKKDAHLNSKKESHKINTENLQKTKNQIIEAHSQQMTSQIERLQKALRRMNPKQKAMNKEKIAGMIDRLRAENKAKREEVINHYNSSRDRSNKAYSNDRKRINDSYKSSVKQYRDNANSKYESELKKIQSDTSMQSTKKSSSKKAKVDRSKPASQR